MQSALKLMSEGGQARPSSWFPQESDAPELIDGIQVKRSGKRSKGAPRAAPRPQLEKPVVNCLACGKVYDCRLVTNDVITFLGAAHSQRFSTV